MAQKDIMLPFDRYTGLINLINTKENIHFEKYGEYGQIRRTVDPVPSGEAKPPANALNDRPTDRPYTVGDVLGPGVLPPAMPGNIRVDVYDSIEGKGYVLIIERLWEDNLWQFTHTVGPAPTGAGEHKWTRLSDGFIYDPPGPGGGEPPIIL